ncbi:MAG TPA: glycosyltransferase family 2 protein [Lachnospiraceae bacterium]|nr:glycosyltransferase family 2 protein [Lachnospiraceae bacterium]
MISILLASYNGEKYIAQQIESVINQTYGDFILYINDDCSTDKTYEIIKDFEAKYPEKIKVTRNEKNSGNAKYNFMKMMLKHKDDYIMLCDQDDVWLESKVEITYNKIRQMENKYGIHTPILVHTDLKIVDEHLATISESLISTVNSDYSKTKLKNEIVQNTLTGCTAMYNRRLADLIKAEPSFMVMHDWWIMLIASAFGKIDYVDKATILYRQHRENVVGVRNMRSLKFVFKFSRNSKAIKQALEDSYRQARTFYNIYGNSLQLKDRKLVKQYAELIDKNKFCRILTVLSIGTVKNGFVRILGQLIYL